MNFRSFGAVTKMQRGHILGPMTACRSQSSIVSTQLIPITLNMNSLHPRRMLRAILWGFVGKKRNISEPLINRIFRNKRISARLAYLAIVVREKITISTLTGYLLENENLGKLRSNLSVVESEPIFPRWCEGVMF